VENSNTAKHTLTSCNEGRYFQGERKMYVAPHLRVAMQKGILHIGFGSIAQAVKSKAKQTVILECLDIWSKPHSAEEVYEQLTHSHSAIASDEAIVFALKNHFVIFCDWYDESSKYSRNLLFYSLSIKT